MAKRVNEDPSIHRRRILAGLGAAISSAAIGCSDESTTTTHTTPGSGGAGGKGGAGGAAGTGGVGGEGGSGGMGGSGGGTTDLCQDSTNLSPEELLARIDTFVILCMENRSFDHYLGSLRLLEGRNLTGLAGTEKNPAPDGTFVDVFKLENFTPADPPHGWDACHNQFNGGKNDGFVLEHAGASQAEVMGYHVREQIPITYALADAHAICDHWFASVMGPTWPNRFYLHGATSKGQKSNLPVFGFKSIFDLLDDANISHRVYYHDIAWCAGGYFKTSGLSSIEEFFTDAEKGTLPNVVYIDPNFFGQGANDDHPDHDVRLGQALIASVYAALGKSPQWNRCMFILTYDEHGGFFDHVPPPTTEDDEAEFRQLGFRVPSIVAGPFTKSGCVVTTEFEHVSVLRTLARRFGLPSLNKRMTAANDLSSCIQPAFFDVPRPAVTLPTVPVPFKQIEQRPADSAHPELRAVLDQGLIPSHVDRRSEGLAITKRVLEAGERLGVVKILP